MSRACPTCGTQFEDDAFFCGHDGAITIEVQNPDEADPRLGRQLGDYVLVAHVADGAMGRVYEARHFETRERVAVKVLHDDVVVDEVAVERFRREYETARSLDNPYIVKVIDYGETEGAPFLTMEYLEGEELSVMIKREGPQPRNRAVRIFSQLALGLQHAHSYGIIHRDLKPDNVFVCQTNDGDEVRILDFGSVKRQMETGAKLTALGTTLGSPYYMSPEQAMGKLDVDQRTDVFAVAAIMYEFATGEVAFEGENVAEILMKIVQHHPGPPSAANRSYPAGFDDVVDTGLSKDKVSRYGSLPELAEGMLRAFGLAPDAERWATASQAEVDAALEGVKDSGAPAPVSSAPPPTAEAVRAASSAPPGRAASSVAPGASPSESVRPSEIPIGIRKSAGVGKYVVAAVIVAAVIAYLTLR